ncbi:ABC transporter ATP-binding protein [Halocatena marina]|uniref:ABC transporter ATP-binding protein n=2 Tax=Halocatena marina TaxID=2934937 RepID=A0ABD5YPR9_9EURY|nr:oligopeptide/dipeptide ABC transporter ATP-binding protein [Halocatena marina]
MSNVVGSHATARESEDPLLQVRDLKKHFPMNSGLLSSVRFDRSGGGFPLSIEQRSVRAVDGVSFDLHAGETLGVVGESGCGKSTLAHALLGLSPPTDGEIQFRDEELTTFNSTQWREIRQHIQLVFQDPQSSLNPRRIVGSIIADPLEAAGWSPERRRNRVLELLEDVGLERDFYNRYPHEFSGGQRQRINLARALSISPDLVIADEPVSGLDMSVQAQILNLMDDLQDEYGLTYLFITHDLSVIRHIADRVAVMYLGDFVETGPTDRLFSSPHHPYTRALLDSVPHPNPDARAIDSRLRGTVPSPSDPPAGCKFHTRCPRRIPPDGFDRESYREFQAFRDAIRDESIDPAEDIGTYFDTLPAVAEKAVRTAFDRASTGEWEDAHDALAEFESVCEREVPRHERISDSHQSACHLSVNDRTDYSW